MQKINNELYNDLGERWYTAQDDPVALLRAESRIRNPWVLETIQKEWGSIRPQVLDVGCGGGFLSNALAQAGMNVTGVDLSEESLQVAKKYDATKSVNYIVADAYALPHADSSFDVVCAMDFLEHVDDPARAIREMSRVLRPKGLLFFHTFNRNWISKIVAIKCVECFVANTPKDMHVIELFIKPKELSSYCEACGLTVIEMKGVMPKLFSFSVLRGLITGRVPDDFGFRFTTSLMMGYSGLARKDCT
ncbi:MAG: bifunctional 2-polyprenyl-6-hydroxyphenol methylase/3-demethylubiquinol 3-O-methyltransferase UbiG [Bdellovibrionota bacterium]